MNKVVGVCVMLEPPGPNRVRMYSVISPLASRGRCQTTSMEDDDRFLVDTRPGAELGTRVTQKSKRVSVTINDMKNLSVGECAYKLTVVISPEVHCAGVVVGRASTSGRSNS